MKNFLAQGGNLALFAVAVIDSCCICVLAGQPVARRWTSTATAKADFTVFRPSNDVWYINKSGGGVNFTHFGLASEDFMAPGDFDGDGKGDISVWRDTTGAGIG